MTGRQDADGRAYIAYYRNDVTTGFVWSGNSDERVQVTREMGEPVIDTFEVSIPWDQFTTDFLTEFQHLCDEWVARNRNQEGGVDL